MGTGGEKISLRAALLTATTPDVAAAGSAEIA
jgi:hypothetical protein